jgi:acetyl-CoA acetyltransferase
MVASISSLRPVHVVGIGLHRYQKPSETTFVELGLTAVRAALTDASLDWRAVESAYVGNATLGMAAGRAFLRFLGATGLSIAQVENASASGSTAFRQACLEVASGVSDVAIAVGVDKAAPITRAASKAGISSLTGPAMIPAASFAMMASAYMRAHGAGPDDLARVAVKNHGNAARNQFAHFQKTRTLEEVLGEAPIAGCLTRLQCCPIGDGAAAAIVASDDALKRYRLAGARAVCVVASVSTSERLYGPEQWASQELTRETVARAYDEAKIGPSDLNVVELHDAFSIEEILYTEALGLCEVGGGARYLASGKSAIGGECAVSPSGGLLGMGHPLGPTGVGQICEITRQLRGEAADRQQPKARWGLAHMVGVGQVCVVHVLRAPERR